MSETKKGKLIIKVGKTVEENTYRVSSTSSRGTPIENAIPAQAKCFEHKDAIQGMEVDVEFEKGQPSKVTIPGKEITLGTVAPRTGTGRAGGRTPNNVAAQRAPANTSATAPYNFISAENPISFEEKHGATSQFSGSIVCTLTALTPLLVAGPLDQSEKETANREGRAPNRKFFTVNNKHTIPGSSIKGMIRNAVEVLSKAPMEGFVSDRSIGFRDVASANSAYGQRFRDGNEKLCAGFLEQKGSTRTIQKCEFIRFDPNKLGCGINPTDRQMSAKAKYEKLLNANRSIECQFTNTNEYTDAGDPIATLSPNGLNKGEIVFTGMMNGKFLDYIFYNPSKEHLDVPDDVWDSFEDQKSPPQEELLKYFRKNKLKTPVFFLVKQTNGKSLVTAIGLARYFRLSARHSPSDLASKLTNGIGLPQRIFGRVGEYSVAGRVCCGPARFIGTEPAKSIEFPPNNALVAGNPAASAVSMYLVQDTNRVQNRAGNKPTNENLSSYDDSTKTILRGRKLYWHRHSPLAPMPPNDNSNVQAKYHPLKAESKFQFKVSIDRLDAIELGAILQGLDLPISSAHKLGLGKAFGLGSVRIDIDWTRSSLAQTVSKYKSLRARFAVNDKATIVQEIAAQAVKQFQAAVSERCGNPNFDAIPHVQDFRRMTEYRNPPTPALINYMNLNAGPGENARLDVYRAKPILKSPASILPRVQ